MARPTSPPRLSSSERRVTQRAQRSRDPVFRPSLASLLALPPGTLFHSPFASEDFSCFPYMMLLPILCEGTGTLHCTLLSADGRFSVQHRLSAHTLRLRPPLLDSELDLLSTGLHNFVSILLDSPPDVTFHRAPRRPPALLPSLPLPPPIILSLRGATLEVHPIPLIGTLMPPSILLPAILAIPGGPRKDLPRDSTIYRVIEDWGLNPSS